MKGEIRAYIEANRGTYTDEAIRETLIGVGHEPAAVDAAFRKLGMVPPPDEPGRARDPSGVVELAWALFLIGGVTGLVGFMAAGSYASGGSLPLFLGLYVGAGVMIILLMRWAVPRFRLRGIAAVLVGLALVPVFAALMLGTCVAGLSIGRSS